MIGAFKAIYRNLELAQDRIGETLRGNRRCPPDFRGFFDEYKGLAQIEYLVSVFSEDRRSERFGKGSYSAEMLPLGNTLRTCFSRPSRLGAAGRVSDLGLATVTGKKTL